MTDHKNNKLNLQDTGQVADYVKNQLSKRNFFRVFWYIVYLAGVLLLQTMVISHVRFFGICAFILPAAAVAVGMFEGASWGTVFGIFMGLITDLFFPESTILYTLMFPVIGFATGFFAQFFVNRRFISYFVVTIVASLVMGTAQMVATSMTDVWSIRMIGTILMQTFCSLPLAVLLYFPPARWIS